MTCWAVLIGVPRTDLATVPLQSSVIAVQAMRTFLEARDPKTHIEYLEGASGAQVRASFDAVGASIAKTQLGPRDTLLVMFAGHGILGGPDKADGWALRRDDALSDRELLAWLRSSPERLRKIVISDCCYGLSMIREYVEYTSRFERFATRLAGMPPRRISYDTLALRFARRLMMRTALEEPPAIPLICLAAASSEEQVLDGGERLFTTLTVGAAGSGHTYRTLQHDFDLVRRTGMSFHVVASPEERFDEIVLGDLPASPEQLRSARCSA